MGFAANTFHEQKAIDRLMRFLAVEGITGQERAIGQEVVKTLVESGVPRRNIQYDKANEQIPFPTQTGNLIVHLPGTRPGTNRLFMTHLDTVPLCAGTNRFFRDGASSRQERPLWAATIEQV